MSANTFNFTENIMSSSTKSDVESLTATGGSTGFLGVFTRKWKIALSVSLLLGAVAVIGICAAAVVAGINIGGKEGRKTDSARSLESHDIDNKAYEDAEVGHTQSRIFTTINLLQISIHMSILFISSNSYRLFKYNLAMRVSIYCIC